MPWFTDTTTKLRVYGHKLTNMRALISNLNERFDVDYIVCEPRLGEADELKFSFFTADVFHKRFVRAEAPPDHAKTVADMQMVEPPPGRNARAVIIGE